MNDLVLCLFKQYFRHMKTMRGRTLTAEFNGIPFKFAKGFA